MVAELALAFEWVAMLIPVAGQSLLAGTRDYVDFLALVVLQCELFELELFELTLLELAMIGAILTRNSELGMTKLGMTKLVPGYVRPDRVLQSTEGRE